MQRGVPATTFFISEAGDAHSELTDKGRFGRKRSRRGAGRRGRGWGKQFSPLDATQSVGKRKSKKTNSRRLASASPKTGARSCKNGAGGLDPHAVTRRGGVPFSRRMGRTWGRRLGRFPGSPTPPYASRCSSVRELGRRPCESQGANPWAWRRAGSLTGVTGTGETDLSAHSGKVTC